MRSLIRFLRPWLGLAAVLLLGAATVGFDAFLKRSPIAGFCPAQASCVLYASDFGGFYRRLLRSDVAKAFREEVPRPLFDLDLWARKHIGIRPTPLRWNVWIGPNVLASKGAEGAGLCIRPGVLLRIADKLWGNSGEDDKRIRSFRSVFYAWREGFLILSESRQYVLSSIDASPTPLPDDAAPDEIHVRWGKGPAARLELKIDKELTLAGAVEGRISDRKRPLTLPDFSSHTPILSISASAFSDARQLADAVASIAWEALREYRTSYPLSALPALCRSTMDLLATQSRFYALPRGWDSRIDEVRLDLVDINTEDTTPVPLCDIVMRTRDEEPGPHPFERIISNERAMPCEWEGIPGHIVPWLGEKMSICLGRKGTDWLVTTQEPLMAALTSPASRLEAALDADLVLFVDWTKFAKSLSEITLILARNQLLPRMNEEDVQKRVLPFMRALGRMGTLRVMLHQEDDGIRCVGVLTDAGNKVNPGGR